MLLALNHGGLLDQLVEEEARFLLFCHLTYVSVFKLTGSWVIPYTINSPD